MQPVPRVPPELEKLKSWGQEAPIVHPKPRLRCDLLVDGCSSRRAEGQYVRRLFVRRGIVKWFAIGLMGDARLEREEGRVCEQQI